MNRKNRFDMSKKIILPGRLFYYIFLIIILSVPGNVFAVTINFDAPRDDWTVASELCEGEHGYSEASRRSFGMVVTSTYQETGLTRTYIAEFPDGTAPQDGWPVVILMHGGNQTSTHWFDSSVCALQYQHEEWKNRLLDEGYAVIAPQSHPPLSGNDGWDNEMCVVGNLGFAHGYSRWDTDNEHTATSRDLSYIGEIIDLIKSGDIWAFKEGEGNTEVGGVYPNYSYNADLDGNNIFMAGYSMGAGMTMLSAVNFADDLNAVIVNSFGNVRIQFDKLFGKTDCEEIYGSETAARAAIHHYDPSNYYGYWRPFSYAELVAVDHPPVYVRVAQDDLVIDETWGQDYADDLLAASVTVLEEYPIFGGHDWLRLYNDDAIDFLNDYLE